MTFQTVVLLAGLAAAPAKAPVPKPAEKPAAGKISEAECGALIDQMMKVAAADEFEKDPDIKKLTKAQRDLAWKEVMAQIPATAERPQMIKDCKEQFTRAQADCVAKSKVVADIDKCVEAP